MSRIVTPGTERPTTTTLAYFFREAARRLWLSKRTAFVAVLMIAISLMIFGGFLLVTENLNHAIDEWQGRTKLTIYLETEATDEQLRAVDVYLGARPRFATRRFVSRAAALEKFKTYFSNLSTVLEEIDENPFPASYEIEISRETIRAHDFDTEVSAMRRLPGVDEVQFDWEWIARLRNLVNILTIVGMLAGGILAIAAAFTIANVIRLTMELYREEVDIMRLVGATETIVRGPFLVEGLLQGILGGGIAIGTLYGLFVAARHMITPSSALVWEFLFVTFLPWTTSLALVAGGTLAGLLGSWLSLREYAEEDVQVV